MSNKRSILFVLSLAICAMIVCMLVGGCGGSNNSFRWNGGAGNRDRLITAIGDVADDLQDIADSALSDGKIINAIQDIVSQYLILDADDPTILNRAIGRTLMAGDVVSRDLTGNAYFDIAVYVKAWSNKHIEVEDGVVTNFVPGQTDFQLTITNNDNHVTKLTITPLSTDGYWQALTAVSGVLKALFADKVPGDLSQHNLLLLVYSYSSANIKVEYDGTTLLEGTLTINYPTKTAVTPDTLGEPVFIGNHTHTAKYNFTLYPQDNKDYDVKFDFDRSAELVGSDSMRSSSKMKLYRQTASGSNQTILETNGGLDITVPSGSSSPSIASLTALDINLANKIRIAESNSLNVGKIIELYLTRGEDISDAELESNAEESNSLLSSAGLALYLNNSANKAGDIRAAVDEIQGYKHVRLGVQFVGSDEVEFVKDIANPDDLQQIRTLVGKVSTQARTLAQLFTNLNLLGNLNDNAILRLIFEDLFGTN